MKMGFQYTLAVSAVAVLTACGGGGSGGATQAQTLYPLSTILTNYVSNASSTYFTFTGTFKVGTNANEISGSGQYAENTVSSTFTGQSALRKTQTMTGAMTLNGTSENLNSIAYYYFDSKHQPLASNMSGAYCETTQIKSVPMYVTVGQSGEWYAADCYTSSNKAVRLGAGVTQFSIAYVSEKTADLILDQKITDSSGLITIPGKTIYRITDTGGITFREQSLTLDYGEISLRMTAKAI